jgi:hypothetical protein
MRAKCYLGVIPLMGASSGLRLALPPTLSVYLLYPLFALLSSLWPSPISRFLDAISIAITLLDA